MAPLDVEATKTKSLVCNTERSASFGWRYPRSTYKLQKACGSFARPPGQQHQALARSSPLLVLQWDIVPAPSSKLKCTKPIQTKKNPCNGWQTGPTFYRL